MPSSASDLQYSTPWKPASAQGLVQPPRSSAQFQGQRGTKTVQVWALASDDSDDEPPEEPKVELVASAPRAYSPSTTSTSSSSSSGRSSSRSNSRGRSKSKSKSKSRSSRRRTTSRGRSTRRKSSSAHLQCGSKFEKPRSVRRKALPWSCDPQYKTRCKLPSAQGVAQPLRTCARLQRQSGRETAQVQAWDCEDWVDEPPEELSEEPPAAYTTSTASSNSSSSSSGRSSRSSSRGKSSSRVQWESERVSELERPRSERRRLSMPLSPSDPQFQTRSRPPSADGVVQRMGWSAQPRDKFGRWIKADEVQARASACASDGCQRDDLHESVERVAELSSTYYTSTTTPKSSSSSQLEWGRKFKRPRCGRGRPLPVESVTHTKRKANAAHLEDSPAAADVVARLGATGYEAAHFNPTNLSDVTPPESTLAQTFSSFDQQYHRGKRICSELSGRGIRDGRCTDAHRQHEQQDLQQEQVLLQMSEADGLSQPAVQGCDELGDNPRRPVRRYVKRYGNVRRSLQLQFDQTLEPRRELEQHPVNWVPEDASCAPVAPVTPHQSSHALRTAASPASPSSPLHKRCHSHSPPTSSVTNGTPTSLQQQQQQQQQEGGFCDRESRGQEGRHSLPDLNDFPEQTYTPRRKYTPKVQKEKRRRVTPKPPKVPKTPKSAPKPKPRAKPPGGQARRAGGRKPKKQQVGEAQNEQQQQPLPGQEPWTDSIPTHGVIDDPDVAQVEEFVKKGDKRRNNRSKSRRRTVHNGPDIVRARHVQDAAPQVGSTHPSCSPAPWPCSSPDDCNMEERRSEGELGLAICPSHHQTDAPVLPLCSVPPPPALPHQTPPQQLLLEASSCTDDDNRLALVSHPGTTDIILYQEPVKKKKSRPRVVLDEATVRIWKLLMGKKQPEVIDEDGLQSVRWEEERRAMKRLVDNFLDTTHQVQGDHTFCRWNGSVLDSVVGAFLTQNVTDHASSSAFMSLAARFPPKCHDGEGSDKNDSGKDQVQPSAMPDVQAAPSVIGQQTSTEQYPKCSVSGQPLPAQEVMQTRLPYSVNIQPNWTIKKSLSMSAEAAFILSPVCGSLTKSNTASDSDECRQDVFPQVTSECASSSLAGGHHLALTYTGIGDLVVDLGVLEPPCQHLGSFNSQGFSSTLQGIPAVVSSSQSEGGSRIATRQLVLGTYGCGCGHTQEARGESTGTSSETQRETTTTLNSVSVGENAGHCEVATGSATVMEQDKTICDHADGHLLPIATAPSCASANENSTERGPALSEDAKNLNPKKGFCHVSGPERAHIEANRGGSTGKTDKTDWEAVRTAILAQEAEKSAERSPVMNAVDWEAVRQAKLNDIADAIKERGMNYLLAGRISACLDRLYEDHKSIDLEWLRGTSADTAKEFLLSIRGLGIKSVECIRLLTLHHQAFPVDTNVGRICVRLGWVPLEPLPEELQLHLLELYPVQETIQQYLWPRLCTLDQNTLYELHYQMITFGKVFCTKTKPNCFHCPMQNDCRHYASSSRANLLLPGPEADRVETETPQLEWSAREGPIPDLTGSRLALEGPPIDAWRVQQCEPTVDMPSTPEPAVDADPYLDYDIEDCCDYRPCIGDGRMLESTNTQMLPHTDEESIIDSGELDRIEELILRSRNSVDQSMCQGKVRSEVSAPGAYNTDDSTCTSTTPPGHPRETVSDITDQFDLRCSVAPVSDDDEYLRFRRELLSTTYRELVVIPPEIACRPPTQLKRYGRLRTVHNVYEIPDNHPILRKVEPRDALDPYTYLLAIWGPGEGIQSPAGGASEPISNGCMEEDSETVNGTLLIPCRTALRGIFPLNGTYFQKNEVFADHESSTEPLIVKRGLLWNLRRRLVYFGTSATIIYRDLTREEIQACGWAACVCVRGFERSKRAPKPLAHRLHHPTRKEREVKRAAPKAR